jgi:dTDP-4-dehydrorhamnose reductase
VLAEEAKRLDAVLVHYSTVYVFDGSASAPYREDDTVGPLSVYGESKLAGERAVAAAGAHALVLRTSWVYGLTGRNFLLTIRRLAAERDELAIVDDQVGVPNWSRAIAQLTTEAVALGVPALAERAGLYHLSARGCTTWYGFARAILGARTHPRVRPIATHEYPLPARRPAYGVLEAERFAATFGIALPEWQDSLAQCLASESRA